MIMTLPLSLAEQLMYSTVKITSRADGAIKGTGTGFFLHFSFESGDPIYLLITNKHVLQDSEVITVKCHLKNGERPSGDFVTCTIANTEDFVVNHPNKDIDLCAVLFSPTVDAVSQHGVNIFFVSFELDLIPSEDEWDYFDAIEDVTMIGSPNGIFDNFNNLPIVRRGITATALSKKYNGRDEFMVDMACFPGSSGSPIFIYDRNGYFDRREKCYKGATTRILLVGILYQGPLVDSWGQIVLGNPKNVVVSSMMHLGNAVRSSQILPIVEIALRRAKGDVA